MKVFLDAHQGPVRCRFMKKNLDKKYNDTVPLRREFVGLAICRTKEFKSERSCIVAHLWVYPAFYFYGSVRLMGPLNSFLVVKVTFYALFHSIRCKGVIKYVQKF